MKEKEKVEVVETETKEEETPVTEEETAKNLSAKLDTMISGIVEKSLEKSLMEAANKVDGMKESVKGFKLFGDTAEVTESDASVTHKFLVAKLRDNDRVELGKMRDVEMNKSFKFGDNQVEQKVLAGGDANAGAEFVPTVFSNNVQRYVEQYGVMRGLVTVFPQTTDDFRLPTITANIAEPAEVNEKNAIPEDQPVTDEAQWIPYDNGVIIPFTNRLLEDSGVALVPLLETLIAERMAKKEDNAILNGTGSTVIDLMTVATAVVMAETDDAFTDVDFDYILDLIDGVPTFDQVNGKLMMAPTILSLLKKIKDVTSGQYIFSAVGDQTSKTIWEAPYIKHDLLPGASDTAASTAFMLFGDFKKYWMGLRQPLSIALSTEANLATFGSVFQKNAVAIRATERFSGRPIRNAAFSKLVTAAQ